MNDNNNIAYKQKLVRIKEDYSTFCDFLDFRAKEHKIDRNKFYDDMFNFSLDHIIKNGFKYYIEEYKPLRIPKGFPISTNTSIYFSRDFEFYKNIFYKKYNRKLLVCEFVELLIYIYTFNNLDQDKKFINIKEWGIKEIDN